MTYWSDCCILGEGASGGTGVRGEGGALAKSGCGSAV